MPKIGRYRLTYPMAVSEDEQTILLVARMKDWTNTEHKLVLSKDRGETWTDISERLGLGPVVEGGIQRIFFDPADGKTAWILADAGSAPTARLFLTTDDCETFADTGARLSIHLPSAYDPLHRILYASEKGLTRSADLGFTWTKLPATFSATVHGLAVLGNGDLVVGDDGRLLVIPFDRIGSGEIEQSMIRLTIGESHADAACSLRTFRPILCRGRDILTFTFNGWNYSNAHRDLGPLLSRDGGRTFQWIVYDLSCCTQAYGLDMNDDKIIIGNRGVHEFDLNSLNGE